jgi:hypothetical protein
MGTNQNSYRETREKKDFNKRQPSKAEKFAGFLTERFRREK